jgi:predicted metal-dependent TIM-barrel fold hydrolase
MDQNITPKLLGYEEAVSIFHEHGLTDLDAGWLRTQANRRLIPSTVVAKKRRFLDTEIRKVVDKYIADASPKERGTKSLRSQLEPARKRRVRN